MGSSCEFAFLSYITDLRLSLGERLYLIPGSSSPLERICIGGDNLLLLYSDDKGRLWDVKTQEFWRSMTRLRAEELLQQAGWFEA